MRESVYVVGVCVWVPLEEGAKSLEAELQVVVTLSKCTLGTERGSSERVLCDLNCERSFLPQTSALLISPPVLCL